MHIKLINLIRFFLKYIGSVAQSVEQRTENPCVGGSIPPGATSNPFRDVGVFCYKLKREHNAPFLTKLYFK